MQRYMNNWEFKGDVLRGTHISKKEQENGSWRLQVGSLFDILDDEGHMPLMHPSPLCYVELINVLYAWKCNGCLLFVQFQGL